MASRASRRRSRPRDRAAQEAVDLRHTQSDGLETARRPSVQLSNELRPNSSSRPWAEIRKIIINVLAALHESDETRPLDALDRFFIDSGGHPTHPCATRSTSTPGAAMTTLGRLWLICSRHSLALLRRDQAAPRWRFDLASTAPLGKRAARLRNSTGIGSSPSATTSTRVEPGGGRRLVPPGAGGTRWSRTNRPRERPGLRKGACAPGETRASGAWRLNRGFPPSDA